LSNGTHSFLSTEIERILAKADDVMNKPEFRRPDTSHSTSRILYGPLKQRSCTPSDSSRTRGSLHSSDQRAAIESMHCLESSSEKLRVVYSDKLKVSQDLLDKLSVSYQRHVSLKKYSGTLQEQLKTSVLIAKQEIRSHYDGLVAELTHKLEEAMSQLEVSAKAKQSLLRDRDAELDCCIQTVWEAHQALELRIRAETKGKFVQNFGQAKKEAEEALEVWASEIPCDMESCKVKCPEFWYVIKAADRKAHLADFKEQDRGRKETIGSHPLTEIGPSQSSRSSTPTYTARKVSRTVDEEPVSHHQHKPVSTHKRSSRDSVPLSSRTKTSPKDAVILDLITQYKDLESKYLSLKAVDKENPSATSRAASKTSKTARYSSEHDFHH
jgi:hypothetical protein